MLCIQGWRCRTLLLNIYGPFYFCALVSLRFPYVFLICLLPFYLRLLIFFPPQADKEFVWSLWKRLQVANPDITQAVALVVQRCQISWKINQIWRTIEITFYRLLWRFVLAPGCYILIFESCNWISNCREKEKAEIKDRKVLDILSDKDERIEELQKVLANQSKELTQVLNK